LNPPEGGTPDGKTARTPAVQAAIAVMHTPALADHFFLVLSGPPVIMMGDREKR
jgi:hypothetical protein